MIYKSKTFVVQIKGKYRGRVGQILCGWDTNYNYEFYEVQFGADGPFEILKVNSIRRARKSEIPEGIG